jgi:uncharacterized protein (TIGR02145 family)
MIKRLWYTQLFIVLFLFTFISSCEKDFRDKYLGEWTFEINDSESKPPPSGSTSSIQINVGVIIYGTGDKDLAIKIGSNIILNFRVGSDGSIGNLPGDYNYGKFDGYNILNITYGHRGNYSTLRSIYGQKGIYSNKPPYASTEYSNAFTYGAYLFGTVNANLTATDVSFEYGLTNGYGKSVNSILNPFTGFKNSTASAVIKDLTSGTLYHFRIKAVSSLGTTYGDDLTFKTSEITETVKDIDGNMYRTVRINNKVWMAENLKATKFNNGSSIPLVVENTVWSGNASSGYCFYNNDPSFKNDYGVLYNYYAVKTSMLCPTGWHIPSDLEWTDLEVYLNGGDLKETDTLHWQSPNTGATNISGFTALPGGCRNFEGPFSDIGKIGYFWSSTEPGIEYGLGGYTWTHYIFYNSNNYKRLTINNKSGFSVRCVKN